MADHLPSPSEDVAVVAVAGNAHCRSGLLADRRRSHSIELPPRQLARLRSIEEHPVGQSRRSSVVSNVAPFSRKNSLCAMGLNKRLSLGPWAHYGRVSFSGLPLYRPIQEVQYENTYRTGPEEDSRFNPCRAQKVVEIALRSYLGDTKYNPLSSGQLAQTLADLIRSKLKESSPARYKVVCNVILGQMGRQGARVSSRSLWDPQNDNFACATYSNATLFAVAMVHGVYYE
ncbi:dynein light chain Tctex-type 4 [Hyla sarda]|uniref:dynein light chain Tctex-type 4 n=1 Tax=Hyla sarda TaxID=327740 RepID=UPI0024C46A05|nr:dynein light chain Tctex-type 4 [Hyla sarda]XP_056389097.1 dynein light chain Tctex-type 4 [Hyla sarda]XP_056389098.1 dynein light chain Tctex-type 4 [Hyla sarda]XP_056389099.1 dynein light chain Tctex-type 4 [Hyla sarda]XP_056389100.1 dynein light chain Tctex-type 4 [Hyla sarda]